MQAAFPLLLIALMWVVVIAPQRRRMRNQQALMSTIGPGDEIVTAGGIYGTVVSGGDEILLVRVAPGVEVRVARRSVLRRVDTAPGELPRGEPGGEET